MIALDLELLAHELAMTGRMLPVDETAVEAGNVFAQRLEFRALAFVPLRLDAVDGLAGEELQRNAMHTTHIGQDVDDAIDPHLPDELDEPERSAPAHRDPVDVDLPTAARDDGQRQAQRLAR